MQELVKKYKDKNVEFFFINVWEKMNPVDLKANVTDFIKENKYSFNVLYDFKDEIVSQYKIDAIPSKIIIDKKGNILSMNCSVEDMTTLIDTNM